MSVRETWDELETGPKVLIGLVGLIVVGVILVMVLGILLMLAVVLSSFALGMGSSPDGAAMPQTTFEGDYDASSEMVEITHDGGDTIEAAALEIKIGNRTIDWDDQDGEVTAGESMTAGATSGASVRVVWVGDEESSTMFHYKVRESLDG